MQKLWSCYKSWKRLYDVVKTNWSLQTCNWYSMNICKIPEEVCTVLLGLIFKSQFAIYPLSDFEQPA